MSLLDPIHGYRSLIHPLAQINAAAQFCGYWRAFVDDEWCEIYTDKPPSVGLRSADMLDTLASLGLRFEVAGPMEDDDDDMGLDNGFWERTFQGGALSALLFGWAEDVMKLAELDHRAFFSALRSTNLIFVPDEDGIAKAAHHLLLSARPDDIERRDAEREADHTKHYRHPDEDASTILQRVLAKRRRGDGPRVTKPAMIDRAAIILRDDPTKTWTPEELVAEMKKTRGATPKNLASLTTALHQVVNYGKPKRLAGCVRSEGAGRYRWVSSVNLPRSMVPAVKQLTAGTSMT